MRTTVTVDDALYEKALEMADPDMDRAYIFREAMKVWRSTLESPFKANFIKGVRSVNTVT